MKPEKPDRLTDLECDICPRPAVWEHRYEATGDVARYCDRHKPVGPPVEAGSLVVEIDISDWEMEAMRAETLVRDREEIVQLLQDENSARVARAAIVSREKEIAPAGIMRPNKLLLQAGAQHEVSKIAKEAAGDAEAKTNGSRPLEGKKALRAAERYLDRTIPRLVLVRLQTIHEKGGDVEAAAGRLKERIDAAVCELTAKTPEPEQE